MNLTVSAWCQYAAPELVLDTFCQTLAEVGIKGTKVLSLDTQSWDLLTFNEKKIFIAFSFQPNHHLAVEICGSFDSDNAYAVFEEIFINWIRYSQLVHLTEVLFSIRNPQPYPFLTFSEHKEFSTPAIVDHRCAQPNSPLTPLSNRIQYWKTLGPELHFIAHSVFDRTNVNVVEYARYLSAWIIQLEKGVIFDCGWTDELALPQQLKWSEVQ
ncbi:MAG: hypothetical protein AAGD25_14425 [Cyanobacteria bacterium P01_F01_bin.150]